MSNMNPNFPTREFSMHKEMSQSLFQAKDLGIILTFSEDYLSCYWIFHIWLDDLHAEDLGITLTLN